MVCVSQEFNLILSCCKHLTPSTSPIKVNSSNLSNLRAHQSQTYPQSCHAELVEASHNQKSFKLIFQICVPTKTSTLHILKSKF